VTFIAPPEAPGRGNSNQEDRNATARLMEEAACPGPVAPAGVSSMRAMLV